MFFYILSNPMGGDRRNDSSFSSTLEPRPEVPHVEDPAENGLGTARRRDAGRQEGDSVR